MIKKDTTNQNSIATWCGIYNPVHQSCFRMICNMQEVIRLSIEHECIKSIKSLHRAQGDTMDNFCRQLRSRMELIFTSDCPSFNYWDIQHEIERQAKKKK